LVDWGLKPGMADDKAGRCQGQSPTEVFLQPARYLPPEVRRVAPRSVVENHVDCLVAITRHTQ